MTFQDLPPRRILERLASELTARQFDVYLLRVVTGASFAQIASMMDISKGTAHQHYAAAKRRVGDLEWNMEDEHGR